MIPPVLPSDLLQVQAWHCSPAKEGPDCGANRLPGLSDLLQVNSWPAVADKGPTRTPLGKMLALKGLRVPAVAKGPAARTRLSTKAAAYVPSACGSPLDPAAPCWTPAAARAPQEEEEEVERWWTPAAAAQPPSVPAPAAPAAPEPAAVVAAPVAAKAPRAADDEARAESTTVMLRNLPPCYTRQMLMDLLAKKGLSHHVDFLYLPINFELSQNVGYSFLNLTCKEQTERLFDAFEGFRDWGVESDRVCSVSWSDTQGLDANIERYRNSPIMRNEVPDEFKPTLLSDGAPVALPKPTRQLRTLRCRKGHGLRLAQDSDSCSQ